MGKTAMCLLGFLALCAVPLLAQSTSNDTLTALLTEVRLLRQAIERTATAPQVQLLGTRLTVQNARLQAAMKDHETARAALQEAVNSIATLTMELQSATEESDRTTAAARQRELQQLQTAVKDQLGALTAREPQLRAREAELAAAVAAEQNEWLLLNRRLDEIERTLQR
jgi:hypothetical protein